MRTRRPCQVAIFSANPETLDGLEAYLRSVGLDAKGRRNLETCASLTGASTLAIVLFPDDFPWDSVVTTLTELGRRSATTLCVLVTSQPKKYERLADGRTNFVVVPRPVWGWSILDAIRSHAEEQLEGAKRRKPAKESS